MPLLIDTPPARKTEKALTRNPVDCQADPLADQLLYCPLCGCTYLPQQGCFCVRVVAWDERALPD